MNNVKMNFYRPKVPKWLITVLLLLRHRASNLKRLFIVQLLYVRSALHRTCLCREVGVFRRGWVTFGEYLTVKGACTTHQPLLVSEN